MHFSQFYSSIEILSYINLVCILFLVYWNIILTSHFSRCRKGVLYVKITTLDNKYYFKMRKCVNSPFQTLFDEYDKPARRFRKIEPCFERHAGCEETKTASSFYLMHVGGK